MWVCTTLVPSKPFARAAAAGDRLVVLVPGVAEGEVVHRALARRHHASAPYSVLVDAGRGLDVARHHRGRRMRVQHAAVGMITFSGFRQPALSGMSSLTSVRNTYSTAAMQTARGALKLFTCCGEVPVKSISRCGLRVDADRHLDLRAVVQRQVKLPSFSFVMTRRTDSSALSCTWPHVGLHDFQPELVDHLAQLLHALLVAAICALQVAHVLLRICAPGFFRCCSSCQHLSLAQRAAIRPA
jgi:hypothetical protein